MQGVALAYIPSVEAFMSLPENQCDPKKLYVSPEIYEKKLSIVNFKLKFCFYIIILLNYNKTFFLLKNNQL